MDQGMVKLLILYLLLVRCSVSISLKTVSQMNLLIQLANRNISDWNDDY